MSSKATRLLLWSACLGAAVLFAGDMLYYGKWGSARGLSDDVWNSIMAVVPAWRLQFGSITGPVGVGFSCLGAVGLWSCCRRAAPRLAVVMAVALYTLELVGGLLHGTFGPVGFVVRICGQSSAAVAEMWKLIGILASVYICSLFVGFATWVF